MNHRQTAYRKKLRYEALKSICKVRLLEQRIFASNFIFDARRESRGYVCCPCMLAFPYRTELDEAHAGRCVCTNGLTYLNNFQLERLRGVVVLQGEIEVPALL